MRRIALAVGTSKGKIGAQGEQSALRCREYRFTLAGWHPSLRSYSCNQATPVDLAERELQFGDDVDIKPMITQHVSLEAHFAFTENFSEALDVGLAKSQCNDTTGMLRCTVLSDLEYASFPPSSISKLDLVSNLLRPQSTLVLSTGEANLGAHNFSNQIRPSSAIEVETEATRLLGQNMRHIQLPMELMSTQQNADGALHVRARGVGQKNKRKRALHVCS